MRRAAMVAVLLVMVFSGVALAKGPDAKVTGTYTYFVLGDPNNDRLVSVDSKGKDPVKGVWSWTQLPAAGLSASGLATCVVVDGPDAWVAGPTTQGYGVAAFLWVHDGGLPKGAGDSAVTWIADPGVQTLTDMETLCAHEATVFTQAAMEALGLVYEPTMEGLTRFPVESGDLVVKQ